MVLIFVVLLVFPGFSGIQGLEDDFVKMVVCNRIGSG